MKRYVHNSKTEHLIDYTGAVIYINKYTAFKAFIKKYPDTKFAQIYVLLKGLTGVYRFNINGKCAYIGYSENLQKRVMNSFFKRCFGANDVEFQYIICDTKEDAINTETHYIRTLKPYLNVTGKNDTNIITTKIEEFSNPVNIYFDDYWRSR